MTNIKSRLKKNIYFFTILAIILMVIFIFPSKTTAASSYNITVTCGVGGTITPAQTVTLPSGGSQRFNIIPNTEYHISNVIIDGISQGSISTYEFMNVNERHSISAIFAENVPQTITTLAGPGGSISPETVNIPYGSSQNFLIVPDEYYCIDNVVVDGVSMGDISEYNFINVVNAHSITAEFKRFEATGGTIVDSDGYRTHIFKNGGTFTPNGVGSVETLVVAGGGGGGNATGEKTGGGGGAGGLIYRPSFVVANNEYTVIVGQGGEAASNGQNSSFSTLVATGGGAGGTTGSGGSNGGSGGGGSDGNFDAGTGIVGQGNNGGQNPEGGGGGGASKAGNTDGIGRGGDGVGYNISGELKYYAGGGSSYYQDPVNGGNGGGGTSGSPSTNPTAGEANTGGGGGAAWGTGNTGAAGGSGIVIIRYPYTEASPITMSNPYYILGLNSVNIIWPYLGDNNKNATASIRYKKLSETNYSSPMDMSVNRTNKRFDISLNGLDSGVPYVVELTAIDPDNTEPIVKTMPFTTYSLINLYSPTKVSYFNPDNKTIETQTFITKDNYYWYSSKTPTEITNLGVNSLLSNSEIPYEDFYKYKMELNITPNIAYDANVDHVEYKWSFKLVSYSDAYTTKSITSPIGIEDTSIGNEGNYWNISSPANYSNSYNSLSGYYGPFYVNSSDNPENFPPLSIEFYKKGTYKYNIKLTDLKIYYNDGRQPETITEKVIPCRARILQPSNFRGTKND